MAGEFVQINVSTGGRVPTGVVGLPGATSHDTDKRYESTMIVSGPFSGHFRLTIYPDDMTVKGRVQDGVYPLFLGFHNPKKPHESDLEVRTNGFRPVIVFNANLPVPVVSNDSQKVTSTGIHIHNGWYGWKTGVPMSEGCLLVHPAEWEAFIKLFLKAFSNLSQWSINDGWLGQFIGFAFINSSSQ